MKEHYVSFEQADKLKDLGFDWKCNRYYTNGYANHDPEDLTKVVKLHYDSPYNYNRVISADGACYSAPRLDQAQAWLREVNHIYVYPETNCLKKWFAKAVDMESNEDLIWDGIMFDTYELALSAGIDKALELLTSKS